MRTRKARRIAASCADNPDLTNARIANVGLADIRDPAAVWRPNGLLAVAS
jgi:hypothetical protein